MESATFFVFLAAAARAGRVATHLGCRVHVVGAGLFPGFKKVLVEGFHRGLYLALQFDHPGHVYRHEIVKAVLTGK